MTACRHLLFVVLTIVMCWAASPMSAHADPIPSIPRMLPPAGSPLDDAVRNELQRQLSSVQQKLAMQSRKPLSPDVYIFTDAVQMALLFDEFYGKKDADHARDALRIAADRLAGLESGANPWTKSTGLVVRGYRSSIDGSTQPYGLVIPESLDLSKPAPLYVWLHGRGDKTTNLLFLHERQTQRGTIAPADAIVLHPWGRYCVGYKSAGEIDVLEAIEHAASQYNIDRRRIVLMGFSMGGAGCWHLGAHYADRWVAMSPGAGFAETAQYQKIDPSGIPPYEQRLWGTYDVPCYVRDLFNLPVIAYSGENDKQIQAARVMEQAFAVEGRKLDHRIGPGMGHKYYPDTLAAILSDLHSVREQRLNPAPAQVHLQTETLRYHRVHWVDVTRLNEHWRDTRVDVKLTGKGELHVATKNVAALQLSPPGLKNAVDVQIDGQTLRVVPTEDGSAPQSVVRLKKEGERWAAGTPDSKMLAKRPGLQGPIDDAFLDPFLVVLPSKRCSHPDVQRWVDFEQARFLDRWRALFRGEPRVKHDHEVTADDAARYHLILWGDPEANQVLGRIADRLPIRWTRDAIAAGGERVAASGHVLLTIFPNPEASDHYVVLNSGPTFREGHDRTNSLQNPKLPDWAILDLSQQPDAFSAGRVVAADFFSESWQLRSTRPR